MGISLIMAIAATGAAAKDPISGAQICKATIAALMGRSPSVIRIDRTDGDVVFLRYTRADGTKWANRCSVSPSAKRVHWASEPGRWRNLPEDGQVFYSLSDDGGTVTIIQAMPGSGNIAKSFRRGQL